MADLVQPFWLASARMESAADLPGWLKSIHIQPRWLDEIITVTAGAPIDHSGLAGLQESILIHQNSDWKAARLPILHDACRKIETGDSEMILLAATSSAGLTGVILCSPVKVGMYNMIPLAYTGTRLALHISDKEANLPGLMDAALKQEDHKASEVNYLSFTSVACKRPVKTESPFAQAVWVKQEKSTADCAISACHDLVTAVSTAKKKKQGLAVEVDHNLDLYTAWIEGL